MNQPLFIFLSMNKLTICFVQLFLPKVCKTVLRYIYLKNALLERLVSYAMSNVTPWYTIRRAIDTLQITEGQNVGISDKNYNKSCLFVTKDKKLFFVKLINIDLTREMLVQVFPHGIIIADRVFTIIALGVHSVRIHMPAVHHGEFRFKLAHLAFVKYFHDGIFVPQDVTLENDPRLSSVQTQTTPELF